MSALLCNVLYLESTESNDEQYGVLYPTVMLMPFIRSFYNLLDILLT